VFGRNALECDPCWVINASKVEHCQISITYNSGHQHT
jgi:hypothetical protein